MAESTSDRDNHEQARLLYEDIRMLWDDQVALADALRDRRKTYLTVIVVLAGLGVFRLGWVPVPADSFMAVTPWVRLTIKYLVTAALVSALISGVYLFTERPTVRPITRWALLSIGRWLSFRAWMALLRQDRRTPKPGESTNGVAMSVTKTSRAIAAIEYDTEKDWEQLEREPLARLYQIRSVKLREAYVKLIDANDRVRRRLRLAGFWLAIVFVILGIAFGVYTFGGLP
jgi:hypothetical protein